MTVIPTIQLDQTILKTAMRAVKTVVPARTPLPIYRSVSVEGTEDGLVLESTSDVLGMRLRVPCDAPSFHVCLPAKLLAEVVDTLPQGAVTLTPAAAALTLGWANGSRAVVKGLPGEEWIDVPALPKSALTTLTSTQLQDIARDVCYAASDELHRPVLQGISLALAAETHTLTAACVDGFQLGVYQCSVEATTSWSGIVHANAWATAVTALTRAGVPCVDVLATDSWLMLRSEAVDVFVRRIDGTFPAYQQFIPTETACRLLLERADLLALVQRVGFFAQAVQLSVAAEDGTITWTAEGEHGTVSETLTCTIDGDPITITVNPFMLKEAVRTVSTEMVVLELSTDRSPLVIRPSDDADHTSVHLVMPLTLGGDA